MKTYETVFIVRPDLAQEDLDKELEFYKKNNIEQHGGKIIKVEPWGKQTMAYDIENFREGVYFLIQFEAETDYHKELELRYRYNENVMRSVVVAIDEKKFKLNPKRDTSGPKRYGKKNLAAQEDLGKMQRNLKQQRLHQHRQKKLHQLLLLRLLLLRQKLRLSPQLKQKKKRLKSQLSKPLLGSILWVF